MVIVQFGGHLVQRYRACVIDSLGLGITCVLYHCTVCTRLPDLVTFAFYAIPMFYILICYIYLSPLIFKLIQSQFLNLLIIMVQVSSNAMSSKRIHVIGSLDYSCTCT